MEHQNSSKTSEKMGYFDRVTVSLHILYTANQETEGSQDWLMIRYDFQNGEQQRSDRQGQDIRVRQEAKNSFTIDS